MVAYMRTLQRFSLAALALMACTTIGRVIVYPAHTDMKSTPDIEGTELAPTSLGTENYKGAAPGFHAVRSSDDWLSVWKDPRPDARHPPPPSDVSFKDQMVLAAVVDDPKVTALEITAVRRSPDGVHLYVTESLVGDGCTAPPAREEPLMAFVAVPRVDDDVHVHQDRIHDPRCSGAPEARIACRVAGSGQAGTDKMSGAPGQTIDCDGTKSAAVAGGTIVDRNWYLETLPLGSTTRLTVSKSTLGATFPLDAWGTYVVRHEVSDDTGKSGRGIATIDVAPPAGYVPIELVWSKFDRSDDPTTFPRVQLHVIEHPAPLGDRTRDCWLDAPKPAWCEIAEVGVTQQLKLKPQPGKRYRVEVKYVDDRFKGAPVACVRTFAAASGNKPVDLCEYPDTVRNANAVWSLGAIEPDTGTFGDPNAKPVAPPSDAGAPTDGGADAVAPVMAGDSGVVKKAPF